jgi:hypothetical protein
MSPLQRSGLDALLTMEAKTNEAGRIKTSAKSAPAKPPISNNPTRPSAPQPWHPAPSSQRHPGITDERTRPMRKQIPGIPTDASPRREIIRLAADFSTVGKDVCTSDGVHFPPGNVAPHFEQDSASGGTLRSQFGQMNIFNVMYAEKLPARKVVAVKSAHQKNLASGD